MVQPGKSSWSAVSIIPNHWTCWLELMGARVPEHLEGNRLANPGAKEQTAGETCLTSKLMYYKIYAKS